RQYRFVPECCVLCHGNNVAFTTSGATQMIVWQAWDNDGIESLDLLFEPDRIEAHGTMIRMHEGAPLRIDYIVIADPAWCAKSLYARSNGREIKLDLDGDADLWACAFPNSLPVRRGEIRAPNGE